jgi:hypothetical protein
MVEQRPFKALVVGSSPTQPNLFLLSRLFLIGEISSNARVVVKRSEAQEYALNRNLLHNKRQNSTRYNR